MVGGPASGKNKDRAQVRLASVVVLVAMPGWLFVSWLGGRFEWPVRYAILTDFATIAAFLFAMIVLFQAWRKGQQDKG